MEIKQRTPLRSARFPALAAALAAALVLSACQESSVGTGGGPLDVTVTAEPTTQTVGQAIAIRADAVGTSLDGTILDFGDGQVDSVAAFGANTQTLTRLKTYAAPGTYIIVARAEDVTQGSKSAQVTVQVNP